MEINVSIRKITKDWESSAIKAMELAQNELFIREPDRYMDARESRVQIWHESGGDYRPVQYLASHLQDRGKFITSLKRIIEFGAAQPFGVKAYKNADSPGDHQRWFTVIDASKLFREIVVKADTQNYRFRVGPDLAGLGVVVDRSSLFMHWSWFRHQDYGNRFHGGIYHYPLENAPTAEELGLPEGYTITHHGPSGGDGWSGGFEGGSYIRYIG